MVIDPGTSFAYRPPDYQSESGYVSDKVFFFRYVILDGEEVRFPQKALDTESHAKLARALRGAAAPQALARMRYISDLLGSLPLKAQGGKIIASLPYYDPRKCQGAR